MIQEALDAAAGTSPAGTVVLGEGVFEIDRALSVTDGVTLQGQGWERTVIRPAAGEQIRCVKVDGGAKLVGVTLTGGKCTD